MIWFTDAKPTPDYRLWLRFSDGREGVVGLREFIFADRRPIVAELKDPHIFADIEVEMDTVVWSNGLDLAPEFLYERMTSREAV